MSRFARLASVLGLPGGASLAAFLLSAWFAVPAQAETIFIMDDFEGGPGNWTTDAGFSVVNVSGNNVLRRTLAGGGLYDSFNTTPLPARLKITADIQADLLGPGPPPPNANDQRNMTISFHLAQSFSQVNAQQGYHLTYFDGFSNMNGFRLYRKDGEFGPETTLGTFQIDDFALDNAVHSLMITDDGTGLIEIFFDNVSIIQVDDSANYIGGPGQFIGVWSSSNADMSAYIDNVKVTDNPALVAPVPEPASFAVWGALGLGWAGYQLSRRRTIR